MCIRDRLNKYPGSTFSAVLGSWLISSQSLHEVKHAKAPNLSFQPAFIHRANLISLSDLKFWKKCVLFLSAIPLAVIGNGVRITSIVVKMCIRDR